MRLSKERYIEKYGEEAWAIESNRRKLLKKKNNHKYYEKNKDKLKESNDNWRKTHPDYDKNRYENNKEYHLKRHQEYKQTQDGKAICLIANYRYSDNLYGRGDCTLTKEWIIDNMFNSKCVYCGDDNWNHLGADRIDNSIPHTPENVVCSCGICNCERQCKNMSMEEFIEYRKTNPRDVDFKPPQEIVEINGKKVIKKVGN